MTQIFKVKVKAYDINTDEDEKIQDGMSPNVILYTGTAAVDSSPFGASSKKIKKALTKRFGDMSLIPDHAHIIIYIAHREDVFMRDGVFDAKAFSKSVANFKDAVIHKK